MAIKAVIFDLFDVLFLAEDLTQRRTYEQRMGLMENGLLHAMLHTLQFKEAVIGRIPASALWQDVALSIGDDPQNWQNIANIFFSANRVNMELVAFIRTLRPQRILFRARRNLPGTCHAATSFIGPIQRAINVNGPAEGDGFSFRIGASKLNTIVGANRSTYRNCAIEHSSKVFLVLRDDRKSHHTAFGRRVVIEVSAVIRKEQRINEG